MTEITHKPCPFVACGSSDAFAYNVDKMTGHCKSCNRGYPSREDKFEWAEESYPTKGFVPKDIREELPVFDEVVDNGSSSTSGSYVGSRGITSSVMEFYGVKTYGEDRQEYPYPSGGIKVRKMPKEFYAKNGFRGNELFGMNLFPAGSSKMVTVVEGELDAMSAFQMLSDNRYKSPVVSLPSASPSGKLWERTKGWLDSFDKIILSVDNDEPGRKVAEVMFDLFPGKVHMMNHGEFKDANDFLQAGKQREYKSAWWSAKKYSPAGFTSGSEDWLKAVRDETPYGYTETPVEALNKVMRGWIKGGITVVKAPPGVGKTSLFRYVQHDLVKNKGKVVANLAMEEMKSTTARGMATYELGCNVNTEEDQKFNSISDEKFEEALLTVVGEESFVSFDIDPHDPLESTLKQCKHAITIYGADYIFIDHLQRLAYLSGVDGATSALTELGVKLVELAKRKNVGIICISHVNNDGHTKYAKSVEEEAIVLLELQRDKMTEDQDEKNTTYLTVTKNRPFATTGPSGMLRYDVDTTMVQEYKGPEEPKTGERDDGTPF
jgi:KaiC/GvpD/RAD55 family RecA-like ATPase